MELPGTGYSIDYPAGWYSDVMEPLGWAVMSQNEVELASGMITAGGLGYGSTVYVTKLNEQKGYVVWFQKTSRENAVMLSRAETDELTGRDILPIAIWLGWEAPTDAPIRDVVISNVRAAVAEFGPPPGAALFYAAIYDDVYLLRVQAPTAKELERFMPTWEEMLQSIKPVG